MSTPLRLIATLAFAASIYAAPIRVGILKGVSGSNYWHTSTHPGSNAIAAMLANPAAANLGQNLIIPQQGFSFTQFGVPTTCETNGCRPTSAQITAFINALDTLDVAIFLNNNLPGEVIVNTVQRQRVADFWMVKGLISLHQTIDTYGVWVAWDTLEVLRMQNHPGSDRNATLRLDSVGSWHTDSSWKFLNRGLPNTVRFSEEWFSFTQNADVLRSRPYVKTTVNIDENSYEGGLGGARAMGTDHPMSWFREFPTGGRFFYTALAHRTSTFDSVQFFRRQLYNAILWAGKYGATTGIHDAKGQGNTSSYSTISVSSSRFTVSTLQPGRHSVEILNLDGKRVVFETGIGQVSHTFTNLWPNSLYVVKVSTPAGRSMRLVTIP